MVHPERIGGRFGERTNQSLKLNRTILKREKDLGCSNKDPGEYLNKYKALEFPIADLDQKQDLFTKKKQFQHSLKGEHDLRLQKREMINKHVVHVSSEIRTHLDIEQIIKKRSMDTNEYMAYRDARQKAPRGGILISEPRTRACLYKTSQHDTVNRSNDKEESKNQKVEEFTRTIDKCMIQTLYKL